MCIFCANCNRNIYNKIMVACGPHKGRQVDFLGRILLLQASLNLSN